MRIAIRVRWLWLCALMVCAAAGAAELPVSDFVKYAPLANPAISPDGKHLAVVVGNPQGSAQAEYLVAVYSLPDLKPVGHFGLAPEYRPAGVRWVSDTRLVMAVAHFGGSLEMPSYNGDILAVNLDGSDSRVLYSLYQSDREAVTGTHLGGALFNMAKLPEGIAEIAGTPVPANGHFYLNLQLFGANDNFTSWDTSESRVYDLDSVSGNAKLVGSIHHGGMAFLVHDGVARLAWGPDDQNDEIAFASADGAHWTELSAATVGVTFDPLGISRDGKRLFARSSMDGGPNQLVASGLDGSGREVLASDPFSSVTDVMWNPETGAPIAAVFDAGGRPLVQYLGDGPYVQIMQALAKSQPDALVSLADASDDGARLLVRVASDRNPGVYALFDRASMHAQPLYEVLPWIKPDAMPARLPIRFRNRAGTELAGYLTLPNGGSRKNLPLVLLPHGGPVEVEDTWAFDPWAAFLASRGYATLQINFRGSSGRGYRFEHAAYRQFATGIQNDLIDGVNWAIAQGYADPGRICVFGSSFGGYAALMQPILAPRLYKCAIDYAGVYDWRIGMHKSDTRRFASGRTYFEQAIGSLDDAKAISPVSMLDRFNVPVLIAHGKDDPRVPYQNATDLRAALKKADKPYEWLAEPGELHGFYGEQHNEQLFTMIQAFLAKYIGPGAPAATP